MSLSSPEDSRLDTRAREQVADPSWSTTQANRSAKRYRLFLDDVALAGS
jgi:hypothetical protein